MAHVDKQSLNKKEEEEALLSFLQQDAEHLRDANNGTPKAFWKVQDQGSRKIIHPRTMVYFSWVWEPQVLLACSSDCCDFHTWQNLPCQGSRVHGREQLWSTFPRGDCQFI